MTSEKKGLERNYLEFCFSIEHVQFNHIGRYFLKLSIQSSYVLLSGRDDIYDMIRIQRNDESGIFRRGHEVQTDVLEQVELNKNYTFADSKFSFFLPRGFCKNDNKYDVYLRVEAYEVESKSEWSTAKLVGEMKFAIYPRTNAPKVKLFADIGEDMYNTSKQETLLRTNATNSTEMHCGYLTYNARFRKVKTLPEQRDSSPVPSEVEPTPRRDPTPPPPPRREVTPPPRRVKERPPRSPSIDESLGEVSDSPVPTGDDESSRIYPGQTHVARAGKEEILVVYHGAVNLPSLPDRARPRPFGSLTSQSLDELGYKAAYTTHATEKPNSCPSWEEACAIEIDAKRSNAEAIVLKVNDASSKQCLVRYAIPVHYITPFHHYHCQLVAPKKGYSSGVRLFVTIVRKTLTLPTDPSSPNFQALEVMLRGVQRPLQNPIGSMVAVARVVTDYFTYKNNMLSTLGGGRAAGIEVTTISFPNPHPSSFAVPPEQSEGHPQLSLPGKPSEQPQWNHPYLFSNNRDKATLFTPGAAIVLEFYQTSTAMSDMSWRLRSPVAFSVILLEQNVYRQLTSTEGLTGLRIDGLPMQGTNLKTIQNGEPTIGVILRLVTSEAPESLAASSDLDFLPLLKSPEASPLYYSTSADLQQPANQNWLSRLTPPSPLRYDAPLNGQSQSRRWIDFIPIKEGELPPHDAMESVLPEYQYIFKPDGRAPPGQVIGAPQALSEDAGQTSVQLLDYQMRELEKYRTAVHKMGQDILTLRQQVRELEAQNSRLRRDLANYNDTTKLLMDSQDLDGLTKPELAARYVALKQKLSTQTSELRGYKERVQKLQNDMIKKNDSEKDLLRMSHAHKSQNELVQKLQDKVNKVRKLEENIRKQEKVIEKQERLLSKSGKTSLSSDSDDSATDLQSSGDNSHDVLMDENRRLRSEISELREHNRTLPSVHEDEEKLEMYERLEKAESRILSLERQLTENARKWGKERSDLLVRLQEADHGLRGSPLLNSYPKIEPSRVYEDPRRYSKPTRKPKYDTRQQPVYYH